LGSVTDPKAPMTREQWRIKRSYALEADQQSRDLLAQALENRGGKIRPTDSNRPRVSENPEQAGREVDVFNTTSWPRTELVFLSPEISVSGDRVTDDRGHPIPSQRLLNGELAFVAREVPSFGGRRYRVSAGPPFKEGTVRAEGAVLDKGIRAPCVGSHGRSPGGRAVADRVDIATPVRGDAFTKVEARSAHEGIPLHGGGNDQHR
jgi:hypothetical protein